MKIKHIVFGRDGSIEREEEYESLEEAIGPLPPPLPNRNQIALELLRVATTVEDLKRALLLERGVLQVGPDGRIAEADRTERSTGV